jgi:hypothetical protein
VLLTQGIRTSIQREIDTFYKQVLNKEFSIRELTKGALTKARAKLSPEAFRELMDAVVKEFYESAPYLGWHNMRVLAIDGTRLRLPDHPSVKEEFGSHGFGQHADAERSLAIVSALYDPLNQVTLDVQLGPYASDERSYLYKHLEKVEKGDLLLLDRGYPTYYVLFLLAARGVEFCVRMKEDWWLTVREFVQSGKKDQIVEFNLPEKDWHLLIEYPHVKPRMRVRLICVDLPNGEKEILCTSLLKRSKFLHKQLVDLYHLRWGVEEAYKLLKARLEVENFSGKTAKAVKQDLLAKFFLMNLTATLAFPIEARLREEEKKEKSQHKKKINHTNALSMAREITIGAFLKQMVKKALSAFNEIVSKTVEIVRPGRFFKRKKKTKKDYYPTYKPI